MGAWRLGPEPTFLRAQLGPVGTLAFNAAVAACDPPGRTDRVPQPATCWDPATAIVVEADSKLARQ